MITSRSNQIVRRARAVRDGRIDESIFIEGVRLGEEAAQAATLVLEDVLYTEKLAHTPRGAQLIAALNQRTRLMTLVSEDVLISVADTKTPQGIVVIANRPATKGHDLLDRSLHADSLIVIMHGINNPVNAGSMLRVAEAAGAAGAVTTDGSTDLFSAKALRAAMGSSFRLPLWTGAQFPEVIHWCAQRNLRLVSTDARAEQAYTDIDWNTGAYAVIVGREASGLAAGERAAGDLTVRIPMRPPVESLNVATALAVVLYEAARQRTIRTTPQ